MNINRGHPRTDVEYEWILEYVDEHGDIVDHDRCSRFDMAISLLKDFNQKDNWAGASSVELGLVRTAGNEYDGITDRGYAYVINKELQAEFDCGHKVPSRFRKLVSNYMSKVA